MIRKAAVFLDRDGVINVDKGYVYRPEDLEWIPGAVEAIRYFNEQGRFVFVITNQSGIARGYYTEADVLNVHHALEQKLKKHGAHIDQFYYCPHHAEALIERYRIDCECRKPRPGMILQAMKEWPVEPQTSFMVGDKESDTLAAAAAGIKGYRFHGGNLYDFLRQQGEIF